VFRAIARVVVLVDDQEAALAFYRDVLGFVTLHDEDVGGFRYLHVGLPGQPTTGLWLMPGAPQAGDQPHIVLCTSDLDRTRQGLAAHGVEVWAERDDDTGRSLHFLDVAGNVIVAAEIAGFEFSAFQAAFQAMDVDRLLTFYAPDAVWVEHRDPNAPNVMRGREAIETFLRSLAGGPMEIAVANEVLGEDRVAFTVTVTLGDGRRVLENVIADLRDGLIVHQVDVEAWD
jgi:predicted enzyme related to lactoylglutathione lyase/ketosteroid isomerase-like protein